MPAVVGGNRVPRDLTEGERVSPLNANCGKSPWLTERLYNRLAGIRYVYHLDVMAAKSFDSGAWFFAELKGGSGKYC